MNDSYISLIKALSTLFIGTFLSILAAKLSKVIISKFTKRTKSETDDFILDIFIKTIRPLGFVISASIAWIILPINQNIDRIFVAISSLLCVVLIVRFINIVAIRIVYRWSLKVNDESISSVIRSLSPMIRASIWSLGIVLYLQNIGVQMAAIWALLSAGGIGAGLALKEPVAEFFEYITILLDKPFQNGQFINIDGVWATVERVGVRSTRLRSLNGEIIVMSNSSLTNGVISNYTEMEYRRLVHRLGVVYETSMNKMKRIPDIIKEIVDSTEDAKFDRCHFIQFGNFSLDIELVYYIPTNNYTRAMNAQERINLEIMRRFEEEKINFAFPTQTIQLTKSNKEESI